MNRFFVIGALAVALAAGIVLGMTVRPTGVQAAAPEMVYELRKYFANEGKAEAMHTRFRDHTMTIFEKHGMKNIAYWTPIDPVAGEADLVYIVAHSSREQADTNWKEFSADPEWLTVMKASHVNGELVKKVERLYLKPTDYSPMK